MRNCPGWRPPRFRAGAPANCSTRARRQLRRCAGPGTMQMPAGCLWEGPDAAVGLDPPLWEGPCVNLVWTPLVWTPCPVCNARATGCSQTDTSCYTTKDLWNDVLSAAKIDPHAFRPVCNVSAKEKPRSARLPAAMQRVLSAVEGREAAWD